VSDRNTNIEPNTVDAIVRLLMLTVYADRVQKPQEMSAVLRLIPRLQVFADGGFFSDLQNLDALILVFDQEIRELMDESSLADEIETAIGLIDSPILIPMVLAAMRDIANADHEYHLAENAIIERAARTWGVPL